MNLNNDYALITGASLGIGKAIAEELSRRNYNTLLVALDTPQLMEVKKHISEKYNTKVDAFGIDLTDSGSSDKIYFQRSPIIRWLSFSSIGFQFSLYNLPLKDSFSIAFSFCSDTD